MADWKKIIVSGSQAELATLTLSNILADGSETTVLTLSDDGVIGKKTGASGTSGTSGSSGTAGTDGTSGSSGLLTLTGTTVNGVITLGASGAPNADVNTNLIFNETGSPEGDGLLNVVGDVIITRDLTVQGTASFQNSENLLIKDRFILLASGSTGAGDGGIVVQQGIQDYGDTFAYDGLSTLRWGVTSSFHASGSGFTPDAFMSTVVLGASATDTTGNVAARYQQGGNIFVSSSQDIYIYS